MLMLEEDTFPCWKGKRFPVLVGGKRFPVRGGKVYMMEGETFPCWMGKYFLVGGRKVSLLERVMFPC